MSLIPLWQKFLNSETAQILLVCAVICMVLCFVVAVFSYLKKEKEERSPLLFIKYLAIASIVCIGIVVFLTLVQILVLYLAPFYDPFSFLGGD